mmetsp:Transcript_12464/g.18600  ORF Transcript_12464/g.18600 Transcript_12464/m.18600 type:complete len:407 (+) Transcript_12464:16-1236(+)
MLVLSLLSARACMGAGSGVRGGMKVFAQRSGLGHAKRSLKPFRRMLMTPSRTSVAQGEHFSHPELDRLVDFNPTEFSNSILSLDFESSEQGKSNTNTMGEMESSDVLLLPVKDVKCLTSQAGGHHSPMLMTLEQVGKCLKWDVDITSEDERKEVLERMIWIGTAPSSGSPTRHFALDVSSLPFIQPESTDFHRVNVIASDLDSDLDAAIMASAVGKGAWHQNTRFCALCGSPTKSRKMGTSRQCTNDDCRKTYFPRVDPAIIVLLEKDDHCLLGRQSRWKEGRYSCIAGFVELGERLEEGLVREVLEETGVRVDPESISYATSQPWPFPQSLMVGYFAEASHGSGEDISKLPKIAVDKEELEDARWFSRSEIEDMFAGKNEKHHIPGPYSLAYHLIKTWMERGKKH